MSSYGGPPEYAWNFRFRESRDSQKEGYYVSDLYLKYLFPKVQRRQRINLRGKFMAERALAQVNGPLERIEADEKIRYGRRTHNQKLVREAALLHPLRPIYVRSAKLRQLLQQEGFQPIEKWFMTPPEGCSRRAAKKIRDVLIREMTISPAKKSP